MGGIGINKEVVWGAKNSIVYHFLLFCMSRAGATPYLQDAKNMMDWGYNWFGVEDAPDDQFLEFLSLAKAYRSESGFSMSFSGSPDARPYDLGSADQSDLVLLIDELIEKMERARPHLQDATLR